MSDAQLCPVCGTPVPSDAPEGFCPHCSFGGALEAETEARGETVEDRDQSSRIHSQTTKAARQTPIANHPSPSPDSPLPGAKRFGDYELLEEIARGGMGIVYRARQRSLDRVVAIKTLLFGPQAKPESIKRFHAEATAAASLQHPNIVAIHEVGVQEGQHYLVMGHVDGPNLAELASRRPLPAKQAARYVRSIAEAIHYAHERGILHRDLKPSNVLVDAQDQPRVTDFGLAKRFEGESQLTLSGQVVGSPGYLPPEQAEAKRGKVSRRSDVYGLGAILYHLLTGRPPFQAETLTEVLHQVLNTEPVALRLLNPSVPRDLETICLKCLEKEPARRYASAQMVAEELDRFLENKPIHARPVTASEKLWRWCQRKPLAAGLGAALTAGLLLAGWSGWQAHLSSQKLEQEEMRGAIDTALAAAWGGDRAAAEKAIKQAERHGAPNEWVRMLNGQIALHTLRIDEAIEDFEQAVALAPGSVAAQAMLATAYLYSGEMDRYAKMLGRIGELSPQTPEDYLFLGAALVAGYADTSKAVTLLEYAKQKRPSGVTFLQLALAEAFHAADTGSWPTVKRALDHCDWASEILGPRYPLVLTARLNAFNFAIRLCPDAERASVLEKATEAARALESTADPIGHMQRAFYFELIGEEDAVLDEFHRATQGAPTGLFACGYAAATFGRNRSAEALKELNQLKPDRLTMVARAYLLLDLGQTNEAETVYRLVAATPGYETLLGQTILLLAGEHGRVVTNCAQRLVALPEQHPDYPTLRHLSGQWSAEDLAGSAGGSKCKQCDVHYYIALSCLAQGERETALRHFKQSVGAGTHWLPVFQWGRVFLARMEQDPHWPSWIRMKESR